MLLYFEKYQGSGNDFIIINGFSYNYSLSNDLISNLCNRHFGIGADGLIVVKPSKYNDFTMEYYNSDGSVAKMCGNGARCAVGYAYKNMIVDKNCKFEAGDGVHNAEIENIKTNEWSIKVTIKDVNFIKNGDNNFEINTGCDHLVILTNNLREKEIIAQSRNIRFSDKYNEKGININWVEIKSEKIFVRTYERGVENETLSCGTGATAAALTAFFYNKKYSQTVETEGGTLKIEYKYDNGKFFEIFLKGNANFVFSGNINI